MRGAGLCVGGHDLSPAGRSHVRRWSMKKQRGSKGGWETRGKRWGGSWCGNRVQLSPCCFTFQHLWQHELFTVSTPPQTKMTLCIGIITPVHICMVKLIENRRHCNSRGAETWRSNRLPRLSSPRFVSIRRSRLQLHSWMPFPACHAGKGSELC